MKGPVYRPLVVFDMDGVLVRERSSWRKIHDALGTSNEDSFEAYMKNEIDDLQFMSRDIERWLARDPSLNRSEMERILFSSTRMKGFPEVPRSLSDTGFETLIVSGGIDLLADKLANEARIGNSLANGIEFDEKGDLTGNGILKVPLRDKGSALKNYMESKGPFHPVISIGDSVVDITMFEISDLSIAFRPESEEVASSCTTVVDEGDLGSVKKRILKYMDDIHHKLL